MRSGVRISDRRRIRVRGRIGFRLLVDYRVLDRFRQRARSQHDIVRINQASLERVACQGFPFLRNETGDFKSRGRKRVARQRHPIACQRHDAVIRGDTRPGELESVTLARGAFTLPGKRNVPVSARDLNDVWLLPALFHVHHQLAIVGLDDDPFRAADGDGPANAGTVCHVHGSKLDIPRISRDAQQPPSLDRRNDAESRSERHGPFHRKVASGGQAIVISTDTAQGIQDDIARGDRAIIGEHQRRLAAVGIGRADMKIAAIQGEVNIPADGHVSVLPATARQQAEIERTFC